MKVPFFHNWNHFIFRSGIFCQLFDWNGRDKERLTTKQKFLIRTDPGRISAEKKRKEKEGRKAKKRKKKGKKKTKIRNKYRKTNWLLILIF